MMLTEESTSKSLMNQFVVLRLEHIEVRMKGGIRADDEGSDITCVLVGGVKS